MEYAECLDKVHGCWYGKCLGCAAGAPVEGIKAINEIVKRYKTKKQNKFEKMRTASRIFPQARIHKYSHACSNAQSA